LVTKEEFETVRDLERFGKEDSKKKNDSTILLYLKKLSLLYFFYSVT